MKQYTVEITDEALTDMEQIYNYEMGRNEEKKTVSGASALEWVLSFFENTISHFPHTFNQNFYKI